MTPAQVSGRECGLQPATTRNGGDYTSRLGRAQVPGCWGRLSMDVGGPGTTGRAGVVIGCRDQRAGDGQVASRSSLVTNVVVAVAVGCPSIGTRHGFLGSAPRPWRAKPATTLGGLSASSFWMDAGLESEAGSRTERPRANRLGGGTRHHRQRGPADPPAAPARPNTRPWMMDAPWVR